MDIRLRLEEFKASIGPTLKELKFTISRVKKSPLSILGLTILAFYVALALLAPVLAPPRPPPMGRLDPYMVWKDLDIPAVERLMPHPPNPTHPFGTTEESYDLYYGCVWGTRTAFRVGIYVVFSSLFISLVIGGVSGYYGGIIDELLMRFTDVIYAFPGLIFCMALVTALPSMLAVGPYVFSINKLDKVLLALVLVGWPSYSRVIRGEVLRVKQEDYVEAAKAVGCSDLRVMVRHVFPNAIYPILIMASLDIGAIVLTAAALSFLGLGAPPGYADWGQLISLSRNYIYANISDPFKHWYVWVIPGLFIFTFVLGWNLLGDAFRDILDPTLRRR